MLTNLYNKCYGVIGLRIVNPKRFWTYTIACMALSGIAQYTMLRYNK